MGTELAQSIKKTENGQPEAATEGRTGTRQTGTGATGWKTEVKAELKAHRGRLIVCALIGILLLAFLISHKNVFEEPWGTNINLAADYGTIPLQEGHELSQSFQSEGQHLDQLFLWIEGAASADGTLLVRLDDENGTLVTQSVAMADYAEDVAKVWVPMDQDLKKGKSYTVTLNYERTAANGGSHVQADAASAGDPGEAQGVIYFRSSGSAALEMPAVGDGGTLEDGITVVFDYERMNIRAFARAIFLVLVLVGLLAVPASFIQGILRKIGVGGHGACGTLTEPFLVEENRQKLSMLASAAVLFLGPVFTYWLVEYAGGNWENVSKSYGFYNIIWYFLFYAAIYVVTDRAAWAAAIVNLVFLALAAANYFVLQFRGKPVLPWELKAAKTAATVAGGYDLQWTQQLLTGVLAAAVFIVLAFRLCSSAHRRQLSATTGQAFRFRIFKDALLVLIGFGFVMIFYESGFQARRGIGTDQWDISGNYANQGFLLSSMSYLGLKNVQAPDGYSQKSVQRIRDSIDQSTASMDGTSTVKTVPQNIIMIMNESLTDYSVFNNFAPSEDVLTFIHSLQENTIKGYLQTPVFGGGTCNTEYESLTGNSLTFLPGGVMPYQMYVTPDTGSARSNGGSGMQENIEQLLKKQRDFFNTGKTRDIRFRKAALLRLRQAIRRREQEISRALQADLGKAPFESYMTEVGLTLSELTYVLRHLDGWTREKKVPTPLAQFHGKSFTVPEPYGVVLVMAPWNYPFLLTMEPLIGALAAGNCCVLKPSEDAPRTSAVIASLLEEIYPKSYVTVVEGDRKISAALLEQRFDYIFFTGSVSVGKLVMEQAAKHLTPVTLELGGKSPCIVDETADLSLAARRIVFGKFLNSGQTCVAPDYVLVQRSVQEKFMQELCRQTKRQLGREPLANPHYPRMVNERHYDRVMHLLAGELAVIGGYGRRQTLQIAPTVLRDVSPEAPVMQEEIFGPVLPVLAFDRLEEALRFVKEREKPLALYLFTADRKTEAKILRQVPFGGGCVNDTVIHLATSAMGFGGVGNSGMGSYHGRDSFETFSHRKSIVDKSTWMDLPVRYQPYRWWKQALLRLFLR